MQVNPSFITEPIPPAIGEYANLIRLVQMEVVWPDLPSIAEIPDEWLTRAVQALRSNIESAIRLSDEIGDWAPSRLAPIIPDDSPEISGFQRTRDVSGYVLGFVALFERLLEFDFHTAEREAASWIVDDQSVFARLQIWVAGKSQLTSPEAFIGILEGLDNDVFWNSYHQRDLLITLQLRWANLSEDSRKRIENRILMGRDKWEGESEESHQEGKAWHILNRLQWLIDQGCQLTFDPASTIAALRELAPSWKPEYAAHATDSRESRGGTVSTDTEHELLLHEPIESILSKSLELAGRETGNFLREHDPFAGLSAEHPRRAYLALAHSAQNGEYPEWAWRTFLSSQSRKEDEAEFSAEIAEAICQIPEEASKQILFSSTYWLHHVHKLLSAQRPEAFDNVTSRLIDIFALEPSEAQSTLISSETGRDWSTDALNSPAGHIALAILEDSRIEGAEGESRITSEWLARLEKLLRLNGDPRRHAINMIAHQFEWFYFHESLWTERHLLSILESDDENDKAAFWAGFLWNPHFSPRLKPHILAIACDTTSFRKGHIQSLAKIVLEGWVWRDSDSNERLLSDQEFQKVLLSADNEFRSNVIWQIERGLEDGEHRELWEVNAAELFDNVWPRQKIVKNAEMSFRLVQLLLSESDIFANLIDSVLPHLTTIEQAQSLYWDRDRITTIVNNNPTQVLAVLCVILPNEVINWPFGIGGVLEAIGETGAAARSDSRYRELVRKWNSR